MAKAATPTFNPRAFLARVGKGRSVSEYAAGQVVFAQGDPADAVFYSQKGKVKITVVSEQGKGSRRCLARAEGVFRRRLSRRPVETHLDGSGDV